MQEVLLIFQDIKIMHYLLHARLATDKNRAVFIKQLLLFLHDTGNIAKFGLGWRFQTEIGEN